MGGIVGGGIGLRMGLTLHSNNLGMERLSKITVNRENLKEFFQMRKNLSFKIQPFNSDVNP